MIPVENDLVPQEQHGEAQVIFSLTYSHSVHGIITIVKHRHKAFPFTQNPVSTTAFLHYKDIAYYTQSPLGQRKG